MTLQVPSFRIRWGGVIDAQTLKYHSFRTFMLYWQEDLNSKRERFIFYRVKGWEYLIVMKSGCGQMKEVCCQPKIILIMQRQFLYSAQLIETDELTTQNSFRSIDPRPRPSRKARKSSFDREEPLSRMMTILSKKARNKKCYALQVLKQFLYFPDSSTPSSCLSISKYDPLLFSDEHLHSLFKIMQTQYIGRKIWAFINLKVNRKQENIKEGLTTFGRVTKQVTFMRKEESFQVIRQVSSKRVKTNKLAHTPSYSFLINNSTTIRPAEPTDKYFKLQTSTSKRTNVDSERELMFSRQRECNQESSYCQWCCSCCCCCQEDSLWQRIQYLQQLQQLVQKRQREQTYSQR